MAIKVSVGEPKTQNEKPFPKLMKNIEKTSGDFGAIVLFTEKGVGTLVSVAYNDYTPFGYYSKNWHMEFFTEYDGTITLQND